MNIVESTKTKLKNRAMNLMYAYYEKKGDIEIKL